MNNFKLEKTLAAEKSKNPDKFISQLALAIWNNVPQEQLQNLHNELESIKKEQTDFASLFTQNQESHDS